MRLAAPHHTVPYERRIRSEAHLSTVKAARVSANCARGQHSQCYMLNCNCTDPRCSHGQYQIGKRG